MLEKKYRITKNTDFKRIYQKGKFFSNDYFLIKYHPNRFSETRFAFVINKKISKKAVVRNKIKRQIREIVRNNLKQFKSGLDIIIVIKKDLSQVPFSQIEKNLLQVCQKAGLL
jgi:ribonuclease P protein component